MSPEICAAERYTLKSDIWSLGCIIYELCAREPPFNAKSHFQLVQKIKEGKIRPIPKEYSPALGDVINSCLRVNPDRRPDTAELLNLPAVRIMRKEKEVVEIRRLVLTSEEAAAQKLQEVESKLKKMDAERATMRQDIEASVRREWEVKARLEIDRQVQAEIHKLQQEFEVEVQKRVEADLTVRLSAQDSSVFSQLSSSQGQDDIPHSSVGTSGDSDFPSTTDITELSMDSPEPIKVLKKSTRTPFGRAQTMFAGTPMDVEMAEPSPILISSLSLSPRRNGGAKAPTSGRNLFATDLELKERWQPTLISSDTEDEDEMPSLPSPTRQKSAKNPFRAGASRPPLVSQRTAPVSKPHGQPNVFSSGKAISAPSLPTMSSRPDLRAAQSNGALKEKSSSPNRRLSKIPSSSNLMNGDGSASPTRKPSLTRKNPVAGSDPSDLSKLAIKNNMAMKTNLPPMGRTLVELAQARNGGRPVDAHGNRLEAVSPTGKRFADRMAMREVATWDPERDEMPSPFVKRQGMRKM